LRFLRTDERLIGETATDDALDGALEASAIIVATLVETERLFVKVTKQTFRRWRTFERPGTTASVTLWRSNVAR
jgi:hypothetical protein